MTEGYKVVNTGAVTGIRGRLTSVMVWGEEIACTYYEVGVTTCPNPKCGPLALFSDVFSARSFISIYGLPGEAAIYLCDYTPSERRALWFGESRVMTQFSHGTILADSIKLVEKVE